jgi:hypothetical protein
MHLINKNLNKDVLLSGLKIVNALTSNFETRQKF